MNAKTVFGKLSLSVLLVVCLIATSWPARAQSPTPQPTPDTPTHLADTRQVLYMPVVMRWGWFATTPAPIIIQHTPDVNEPMARTGFIEIVFDRGMDQASVAQALTFSPPLPGQLVWRDARTLQFKPNTPLAANASVQVNVASSARASDGTPVREAVRFTALAQDDLRINQAFPAPNADEVAPDAMITVMFNRPVVPLGIVSPDAGALPKPLRISPNVAGVQEWLNTSVLIFRPAAPLPAGTPFRVTIGAGLTDTLGTPLASDYTWVFTTTAPKVMAVEPTGDSVLVDSAVRVRFDQPIEAASTSAAFTLRDAKNVRVSGTTSVLGNTLVFTPSARLAFDSGYSVQVAAGVLSVYGGAASTRVWQSSFSTVPLPQLIGIFPSDGSTVNAYASLQLEFNTEIDARTVLSHVRVTPPVSLTQQSIYCGSAYNRRALCYLSVRLQPSSHYVVEVLPGIADPFGNLTQQGLRSAFNTESLPPYANLNASSSVMLNVYLPTRLQVSSLNVNTLNFELVALDLSKPGFWGQPLTGDISLSAWGNTVRTWSVGIASQPNREVQTWVDVWASGNLPPGMYVLRMTSPDVQSQRRVLINATYANVTLKTEPKAALIWATDLKSGQPISNMRFSVFALRYTGNYGFQEVVKLGEATTNRDGIAQQPLAQADSNIVAQTLPDATQPFAAINMWNWRFAGADLTSHLYTDRPIYRAGQKIYIRGLVRADDDVRFSLLPSGTSIQVEVRDATYQLISSQATALDEFGSFNAEVMLKPDAPLGNYSISAQTNGRYVGSASVLVAAYRPPEYEATVTPSVTETLHGTAFTATVSAYYLSGGALANARVSWSLSATPAEFRPPLFERYQFNDNDNPWSWYAPTPADATSYLSGSGQTNTSGQFVISVPATAALAYSGTLTANMGATLSGADNQQVSASASVLLHPAQTYVGIALNRPFVIEGQPVTIDLLTLDTQGQRKPSHSTDVQVLRRVWTNSYDDATHQWRSDVLDEPVLTQTLVTDANGEAHLPFTPPDANTYRIVARVRDATSRVAQSSQFVWVVGSAYASWFRGNGFQINLIADKATYAPGDTAEILIPSPFSGEHFALVTIERGHVLQHEVVRLTSNSTVYRLPITAQHAPNIFVSVVLMKGAANSGNTAQYTLGSLNLTVLPIKQTLSISLIPDRSLIEPGTAISYTMLVRDSESRPVIGQFSLDLVDKAVLNLQPREVQAILKAFYGKRGLSVGTGTNLAQAIEGPGADVGPPTSAATPAFPPPVPTQAPPADFSADTTTDVRENFQDTAYWSPNVTTDADGRARVKITLPDNTTTWVLRAVGITSDTKVGEGSVSVTTTKPLIIRPVTPRFLVVGDEVELAAIINNNTDADQLALASLLSDAALQVLTPLTVPVSLSARGETSATWRVRVLDATQTNPIFKVSNSQFQDAARPRLSTAPNGGLKILQYSAPEVVGTAGVLEQPGLRAEAIALPPKLDSSQGNLTVRLDPSLIAAAQAGLSYLKEYPSDCAECILSSFLPNVLTYDLLKQFNRRDAALEATLKTLVRDALTKLYALQHSDGGWGWNRDYASNPHTSLYALFALVRAKQAGFEVSENVIARAKSYAQATLRDTTSLQLPYELNRQAYALYVLATAGDVQTTQLVQLYSRRSDLSHHAKALLALALGLGNANDARIQTLLADLNSAAIASATGMHWEERTNDYWAMNTDTRTTALALMAFAKHSPANTLAANALRWLMAVRINNGTWRSTYETAWVLIALTEWARVTGELNSDFAFSASLNQNQIAAGIANSSTLTRSVVAVVPMAGLKRDQTNRLDVFHDAGIGRLYYTAHLQAHLPVPSIKAIDRGIQIRRRFVRADCTLGAQCPEVSQVKLGDELRVQLTLIAPHDLNYVQLEDVLPAGMEARAETSASNPVAPSPYANEFFWWRWTWYSRVEFRDDRVVLFASVVPRGTYEYSYVLRATNAGQFNVLPSFVHEQYFPEVFGRGDGVLMTVTNIIH